MESSPESQFIFSMLCDRPLALSSSQLKKIDWTHLIHLVNRSRLGPLLFNYIANHKLKNNIPTEVIRQLHGEYTLSKIRFGLQHRWASEVINGLRSVDIDPVVIKGIAHQHLYYNDSAVRISKDLDILIPKSKVKEVKQVFFSLNYIHGALQPNGYFTPATAEQVESVEQKHHEMAYLVKQIEVTGLSKQDEEVLERIGSSPGLFYARSGSYYFYSVFDVHWNLFNWFDADEIFSSTASVNIGDETWRVLSDEWKIFFCAFKVYFESFDHFGGGLHHLLDIAKIISQKDSIIDWKLIGQWAEKYSMQSCCFYVFGHVTRLWDLPLPQPFHELMTDWSAMPKDKIPKNELDFGDFLPFALGERIIHT